MLAKLTKAMLADLHTGNAAISLLDATDATCALTGVSFANADQLFSLEDSLTISSGDPSYEDTKIDQNNAVIDSAITEGDSITISGNLPTISATALEYFYTKGVASASITGQDGSTTYGGQAFFMNSQIKEVTMLVESASKKTAIIFAKVLLSVSMQQDAVKKPLYLKFSGKLVANPVPNKGDFAVLKAVAPAQS